MGSCPPVSPPEGSQFVSMDSLVMSILISMSFGDIAQSGFYGWEYGGVYLDGVIVAVVYMIVWRLV